MRVRAENPHNLPSRMYERHSTKRITWWAKGVDGRTKILRSVPKSATDEQIGLARAAAIVIHSTKSSRQGRISEGMIEQWVGNAGIAEKSAVAMQDGMPKWALLLYQNSRRRSVSRGVLWSLTKHDFCEVIKRAAGLCEVSGMPLSFTIKGPKGPYGPSIDRISANGGYTSGNVRIVCVAVNFALNSWGLDAFLPIAKAMAKMYPDSKVWNIASSKIERGYAISHVTP